MAAYNEQLVHLVIVRHGLSEGNVASRDKSVRTAAFDAEDSFHYRLTKVGRKQAKEAGQWIKKHIGENFDAYICSPYARTQETAALLGLTNAEWVLEPGLQEAVEHVPPKCMTKWEQDVPQTQSNQKALKAIRQETKKMRRYRAFLKTMEHVETFLTRYVYMNCTRSRSLIVVCHANVIRFLRFRLEHMTPEHLTKKRMYVQNAEVLWYSRVIPFSGSLVLSPTLEWRVKVNEKNKDDEVPVVKKLTPIIFKNDALLRRVEKTSPPLSTC